MQTVYLNGGIAQFGTKWSTNCANIRDVFKLIDCQTPGFRKYLIDAAENNVGFEIQRGEDLLEGEEELLLSLRKEDIIITEVPAGAKSGAQKILAAIAIVAVIYFSAGTAAGAGNTAVAQAFTGGGTGVSGFLASTAAMVATNLALMGVTQLLSPGPETDGEIENASYLFDGPVTSAPEGLPVPVLYGELIVGGMPISIRYRQESPFANQVDLGNADAYVTSLGAAQSGDITPTISLLGSGTVPSGNLEDLSRDPAQVDKDRELRNDAEDAAPQHNPVSHQFILEHI